METKQLLKERSSVHGAAPQQFRVAQVIKTLFRDYVTEEKFNNIESYMIATEALDMIAVKLSRIMVGKSDYQDHWDDIAGYAKIYSKYLDSTTPKEFK